MRYELEMLAIGRLHKKKTERDVLGGHIAIDRVLVELRATTYYFNSILLILLYSP